MPFKSHAQEAYLKHNEPSVYSRWKRKHGSYRGKRKYNNQQLRDRLGASPPSKYQVKQ